MNAIKSKLSKRGKKSGSEETARQHTLWSESDVPADINGITWPPSPETMTVVVSVEYDLFSCCGPCRVAFPAPPAETVDKCGHPTVVAEHINRARLC